MKCICMSNKMVGKFMNLCANVSVKLPYLGELVILFNNYLHCFN